MPKIRRSSMKDQVYEIVKERILNQEYKFGESISILGLSQELGISNTPIREAMNMLVVEGLLTSNMNNKFRVLELSGETQRRLDEVVCVLLNGSYLHAHFHGKDDELADMLEKALIAQKKAFEANVEDDYINRTMEFDRCFVDVTKNPTLIDIYEKNSTKLYLFVRKIMWEEKDTIPDNIHEHEGLLEAVKAKDPLEVVTLLEKHYNKHFDEKLREFYLGSEA